jgi:recombinational DNA repair protein RecR
MEKLKALERLEESLNKLPSVGKKSAERLAFAMLDMEDDDLKEFAEAVSS